MSRIATDYPEQIAKHRVFLKKVALTSDFSHVLLRHFASNALLKCAQADRQAFSQRELGRLRKINESPFPQKIGQEHEHSAFESRPSSAPEPALEFHLAYNFEREVHRVSDMFDRPAWEAEDAITEWVRTQDPQAKSMYEKGGRAVSGRSPDSGTTSEYDCYGYQLGWHALYVIAGRFLAKYPIVKTEYDGVPCPWGEWLRRELLTRRDGLWLADGTDCPPVDTLVNLREQAKNELILTSDKKELLALLGIDSSSPKEIVVAGDWHSSDNISVNVRSALVTPRHASHLARALAREDPFQAWLPSLDEDQDGGEYRQNSKPGYTPWIVLPSIHTGLDERDPLGATVAARQPHFSKSISRLGSLKPSDAFNRAWLFPNGQMAARGEAWRRNGPYDEGQRGEGNRLLCNTRFLKTVLTGKKAELLLLVVLRRYESGYGTQRSQYWHTTAVITVRQSLNFHYYHGACNQLHKSKY